MTNEPTALDEILDAMRHDEGCSAAHGEYRCRCRLAECQDAARAELAELRAAAARERERCAKIADDLAAELQSDIALTQMHGAFPILSNGPRILELQKRCVEQVAAAIRAKPGEHGR